VASLVYTSDPPAVVAALTEAAYGPSEDLASQMALRGINYVQFTSEFGQHVVLLANPHCT
jgi:uncharacterized membrane protein YqgA involved in biofilm formation